VFAALIRLTAILFVQAGLLTTSSFVAAETPMDNSHSSDIQKPVFTGGTIVCGIKSIWKKPGWPYLIMCIDNDALCTLGEAVDFGKGKIDTVFFMNSKDELIGNSSAFIADVRDAASSDKKLGTYKFGVSLVEGGLVRVESICLLDDAALLKTRYSTFKFPPYMMLSGEYVKGEKKVSFDEKTPINFGEKELEGAAIRFFPGSNEKSFTIFPDGCSEIKIASNFITFCAKQTGIMSFLLDIRGAQAIKDTSGLSPNGIDFFEVDKLHLPDYGASKNLILNPSFEAGLRYWGYPLFAHDIIPLKYTSFYELDDKEAHSGSQSLRVKALPMRNPLPLAPFTIPFVPGENYTLSFYAKGSFKKNMVVNLWGRGLRHPEMLSKSVTTFAVDEEWTRYTTSLSPDDRFGGIYFWAQIISADSNQQEGSVWIDDIQLEKGGVTDFAQPPISVQLVSTARGNFLEFGQKPDFNLIIQSVPDVNGTVFISVEDFFFKKIFEETYKFKADSAGKSSINLDAMSNKILKDKLRGVFAVSGVFAVEGAARPFKDYFRFSVMDFLDNTHKNKNIFNLHYVYSLQDGGPDMERFMERERAIGFGSFAYDFGSFANDLDYALDEERIQLLEKYGIAPMGRGVVKHGGGEISEQNGAVKMTNINNTTNPTDKELAEFESICALKAKNRPWNKIWWFTGESNPGCEPLESVPDAFAKFLLATCRGIKRGNPEAKVLIEGGPWNMDSASGTKWVERYIQDTRRIDPNVQFDGAAAHHYRNFPENPDLDSDVGEFIKMLDRNGCGNWPVYINEGGNYCPFNIPQEGISPYICHSANNWYTGPLSYHIGKSERISAAFSVRNWLVALKYQNRVACMQDFDTPGRYMDIDFTPRPYDKMPNTLGRLLGNASFYKDIRFAPYVRCYVFKEDKTGSPIAAIWGHKESVDRWKEEPPLYTFDFGGQNLKFIDLMENEVSYPKGIDGGTVLPMSPFPLFIKGVPGAEEQLCNAIANGISASADARTLDIYAFPNSSGIASVIFRNPVSKEFRGEAKIVLNSKESTLSLKIPPMGQTEERIDLRQVNDGYGKLLPFDFMCSIDGGISIRISGSYMLFKNNSNTSLNVDGNLSDWKDIPAADIGAGFMIRAAVSNGKLLVAIEAREQNLLSPEVFAGIGLYIDPFEKTNQWHIPKVATQDLAVFEFIKSKENTIEAFCHYVQGTQAGSGSGYLVQGKVQKNITVRTSADANAAFMVFSVPQDVLSPLILKAGSRFGLNISVPFKKNEVKTLAPIGNFKNAGEPGEIYFVMAIVSDS